MKRKRITERILAFMLSFALVLGMVPMEGLSVIVKAQESTEVTDSAIMPAFEQSETVDGVTVTVTAEEGVFPERAGLSVSKVSKEDTKEAEEAVSEEREDYANVAASYTFDIKVLDTDGNELQPENEKSVQVSFAMAEVEDKNLETQVYHISENKKGNLKAEKLDVQTDGDTAIAETDGFSLYTVEFTYDRKQYVLPGDSEVALSEVLDTVGLTGEVSAVGVSNESLFSAKKCKTAEGGKTPEKDEGGNAVEDENGTWFVFAHQAFNTEEWMKVTIGGVVYEITVTDTGSEITVTGETTSWEDGKTYKVTSDVTIATRISVNGNVTLNLGEGKTLTASQGIEVSEGNTLTIEGSGTLNATGAEIAHSNWTKKYRSGIGADKVGTIIINGGTINATGYSWAAGIGGDSYNSSGGSITINGGIINATGQGGGAGIGGGNNGAAAGSIVINGGQVTATAKAGGAGIGSGDGGADGGSLTLGWTNVHTDFIEAKRGFNNVCPFNGLSSISFVEDKLFLLDGTATQATVENINQAGTDVKLVPTMEIVDLSNATISGVDTHYEYTGNDIAITPTVTLLSGTLTETDDYTVSYKRNGTEATTVNEAGTYTLTVTGTGFYTGSTNVTFYVNGPANYQAYENGALADKALAYDGYTRVSAATTAMTAGWYVVAEDVTIADRITTSGDVNLVLCNGATLRVQKGIGVTDGNSLTIYGQDGNTGKIVASIPDDQEHHYHAAIGGDRYSPGTSTGTPVKAGSITIHGGEINATSYYKSAGIGKAYEGSAGLITIYGGKVTATCTGDGIGIGGSGATITLGYSNADDFIQSKSYDGAVTIMSGRIFVTNDTPAVNVSSNVSDNATINNKKLTPKTYTVSFNLNGADGSIASQTTYHGLTKAVEPEAPTRTGYTFAGWKNGASEYDFSAVVIENLTLTADWTANTYKVRFNGNGSTGGSMNDQSFTYDEAAKALTANGFTRGFTVTYDYKGATDGNSTASDTATATFNGWAESADGEKKYDDGASVQNLTDVDGATVNLYAKWTDGSVTLPAPTKTGSIFDGWYSDSGLTIKVGDGGASYKPTTSTTLYAKWTEKTAITPVVNITDWTYGSAANEPGVTAASNPGSGAVEYEYFTNAGCTTKTTAENSGAASEGGVPKYAGTYYVKAIVAETDGYKSGTGTASFMISKKSVTITGLSAKNRDYAEGNISVELIGTKASVVGAETGDDVSVDISSASGSVATADAGENKAVTVNGVKLGGTKAGNYTISGQPTNVIVTINKIDYAGTKTAAVTVRSGQITTDATLTLPALPTGASYAETGTAGGDKADLISGTPAISGTTLTYSTTSQDDQTSATITIKVTGATNYNDYDVVVTVTARDKEEAGVSITGGDQEVTYGNATFTLSGTVAKAGTTGTGSWKWTSSDTGVAEIGEITGIVTVKKTGQTTVKAVYESATTIGEATITLTVKKKTNAYTDNIGAQFYGYSLSLDGNIGVNFYMELDDSVISDDTAFMRFSLPNGTSDVYVKDIKDTANGTETIGGKTYYIFRCEVNAMNMTYAIKAQMHTGTGENEKIGEEYSYSVKDYADYLVEHKDDKAEFTNAVPVVKAMLNYGAYSQIYFNHAADALANANTDTVAEAEKDVSSVTAEMINKPYTGGTNVFENVTFTGVDMVLRSETVLRMYFTNKTGSELTVTAPKGTVEQSGETIVVSFANIKSYELDNDFTVTLSDGSNNGSISYCPLTYCYNVLKRGTEGGMSAELQNVVRSLYLYNKAANEYFHK